MTPYEIFSFLEWKTALLQAVINQYDGDAFWVINEKETKFSAFEPLPVLVKSAPKVHYYAK